MFESGLLSGKRILITGGAGGLGRAMTERFAQLGASIVICGRDADRMRAALEAESIKPHLERVTMKVCDIRNAEAVAAMMREIWAEWPLTTLVNNAAASFVARTESLSARAADAILAPTLHGALYATLEAGRRWIADSQPGVVLSILSTSVYTGRAFTVPSAMGKAALQAMTKSLAVEWGRHSIRTVGIAPGPFPTEGASSQLRPDAGGLDSLSSQVPLGRVGAVGELADLAAYLISDRAGFVNGETVTIDGGMHLRSSGVEDLLAWPDERWNQLRTPPHRGTN